MSARNSRLALFLLLLWCSVCSAKETAVVRFLGVPKGGKGRLYWSGCILDGRKGLVLTCTHWREYAARAGWDTLDISVVLSDESGRGTRAVPVESIAADMANDIELFRADGYLPPVKLEITDEVKEGEKVRGWGYPGTSRWVYSGPQSVVSVDQFSVKESDYWNSIEITGRFAQGWSGASFLNDAGQVVGVLVLASKTKSQGLLTGPENIRELLSRAPSEKPSLYILTTENCQPCQTLHRDLQSGLAAKLTNHFRVLLPQGDETRRLMQKWSIQFVPSFVVVASSGTKAFSGYSGPDDLFRRFRSSGFCGPPPEREIRRKPPEAAERPRQQKTTPESESPKLEARGAKIEPQRPSPVTREIHRGPDIGKLVKSITLLADKAEALQRALAYLGIGGLATGGGGVALWAGARLLSALARRRRKKRERGRQEESEKIYSSPEPPPQPEPSNVYSERDSRDEQIEILKSEAESLRKQLAESKNELSKVRDYIQVPVEKNTELYRRAMDIVARQYQASPSFQAYHKAVEEHFKLLKSGMGVKDA